MDYILRISGDFKKGVCDRCPISCEEEDDLRGWSETCPLEEVKQGEWMDNIVERLESATESVYNEVKGDYFDYIKTADAIEIVRGGKE
jgi:hypothetical protein